MVLEYKTNPGRSLPFLIRNKARPNHPVIGIAMMASPVIGLGPRDERLCLTKDSFLIFLPAILVNMSLSEFLYFFVKISLASVDAISKATNLPEIKLL